jgi:hypothetical protein
MWDHQEEYARFMALGLTDEQNEMLLHGNFERLFHITV